MKVSKGSEKGRYEGEGQVEVSLEKLIEEARIRREADANSDELREGKHCGLRARYRNILVNEVQNWLSWLAVIGRTLKNCPRRCKVAYCCSLLSVLLVMLIFRCHGDKAL
jgi:hypothetical protein